jgi:hypothetical protein
VLDVPGVGECAGKFLGEVEASESAVPPEHRHWRDESGVRGMVLTGEASCKGRGKVASHGILSLELGGVDLSPDGAVVGEKGASGGEAEGPSPTVSAARFGGNVRTEPEGAAGTPGLATRSERLSAGFTQSACRGARTRATHRTACAVDQVGEGAEDLLDVDGGPPGGKNTLRR